jgi:hypothetical protein
MVDGMLSVDEFTAVRSVGFAPLGQVMGVSVHQADLGFALRQCGWYPALGYFGANSAARGDVRAVPPMPTSLRVARDRALERMVAECAALGGDGVVDVTVSVRPFVAGSTELSVIGTAVRAIGPLPVSSYGGPLRTPFTSDLTGHDFALLVRTGWMPTRMVFGLASRIVHAGPSLVNRFLWNNVEVGFLTELVHSARLDARTDLDTDARNAGGLHVVVRDMRLRQWEQECPSFENARDYLCQSTIWGTAITPVRSTSPTPGNDILPILRLDSTKDGQ